MIIENLLVSLAKIIMFFLNMQFLVAAIYRKNQKINIPIRMLNDAPLVTVLIPCCNENESVLIRSLRSCSNIDYENYNVVLIENSSSSNRKIHNICLAESYNVIVLSIENVGSKAAALNFAMNKIQSDYFVIIDADQDVVPSILTILVAEMLISDETIACVQTAQCYENRNMSNFWELSSSFSNKIFYKVVCVLYEKLKISPCLGTNFIFRDSYIRSVGGFPDYSLTEDIALTFALYRSKYKIKYLNIELAKGISPNSLHSYFIQQYRWAKGTSQVFKREVINLFILPASLFLLLSFFFYYLLGGSIIILSVAGDSYLTEVSYVISITSGAILLYIALVFEDGYKAFFLIIITIIQAPIHLWGLIKGLLFNRGKFYITPKEI